MATGKILNICTIFCFLFILPGCLNDPGKKKTTKEIIDDLQKVNTSSLIGYSASMRSREYDDNRIIVSDLYNRSNGGIMLIINRKTMAFSSICLVNQGTNKLKNLSKPAKQAINKSICELGLNGIAVDSCENVYFSINSVDTYQYVLVRDTNCLFKKFTYSKFMGDCFKINHIK
jgi:hypothetical protein